MTIKDLYAAPRPAVSSLPESGATSRRTGSGRDLRVSYELYPPRNSRLTSQAWAGIDRLLDSRPDYVSVTFGTSGTTPDASQSVLWHALKRSGRPVLAHLTCLGKTRTKLVGIIQDMMDLGVRDFLALRGDEAPDSASGAAEPNEFDRAFQLVQLIREVSADYLGDAHAVSIAVAAYPAGSIQTRTDAVQALVQKQAAGADFAITQVFYQARDYAELVQSATYQGVTIPIVPGIIPFTDMHRLQRLEGLTGVPVPERIKSIANISDPAERILESLGATLNFVNDLIEANAPGIHFYTFNRPRPVLDLVEHLRSRGFTHVDQEDSQDLLGLMNATMHRISP
ncbi:MULTISPECIES: methylenetetrahydrofolate reductase [Mobiluncus]|uniref:Methylenetetrahydrofolate reductase n=2 Tax=Mobiluncus TaxID=2050 RepID=A0A2X2YKQ7_9ACTO|nr:MULTISPECIES: methylenetetrahydrofolate reductase [Mobiluncus]EFL93232.1 methylenetetrahydrofolate reductase (NAD(P)H) [Mobiluncus curtisii subsp. curtisii ATCC 35241]EFU82723.1 methylenetetrahydrofolate reductase (NAD(P)H) [Mobiluncus holmesii ATCC 35242]MCU9986768.1 5,10-methylenetetrahydrofolate reductase [Mobiluncus curtisii]MCU9999669.1 5,10-methylenetetrahydrofolate reductase [Mobiluncus curtisii]NMW44066.1 5,10-methylenetetrahydrofolate reductase [Mobiluncus curtisii]